MDSGELQEQVLVAAFPNRPPEVHVASLDAAQNAISLKEAKVLPSGDISFGKETVVSLKNAGDVDVSEGNMLAILGRDGSMLCQLHLESAADQRSWGDGIRAVIAAGRRAAPRGGAAEEASAGPVTEDTDDEVHLLQARSRQLQTQIGQLEAANERRDSQLAKMLNRLDSAMQMLVAVQDMCEQQRKVIDAQKVAIHELTLECEDGDEPEEEQPAARDGAARVAELATTLAQADESSGDDSDAEADIKAKTDEMLALLQKADEMQNALAQMEALGSPFDAEARAPAPPPRQAQPAMPLGAAPALPVQSDASGAEQAALERLATLEAEKTRFEGMLQDSQSEHDDLLQRLDDMRSLMSMLGMQPDQAGDSDDSDGRE